MKKTMPVFVGLILLTIGLFGSTYSSPDANVTDNIFDFHISWGPYEFYDHSGAKEPHQMWIDHFVPQLEMVNTANATFVRVTPGFSGSMVADINCLTAHPRFWTYALARFNASLSYLKNNNSIDPLMCTFPIGHYADSIDSIYIDTINGNDTIYDSTRISFGDEKGYYWYWTVMTQLYTSLEPSIEVPWCSIPYEQFEDATFGIEKINNDDDRVIYWEICNEPANASFLSWGGYFDTLICSTYYNSEYFDSIKTGNHNNFKHFCDYIKISADAIHAENFDAQVIGPATIIPLPTSWDSGIGYRNDSIFRLENDNAFSSPFDFWYALDTAGALNSFDIISVHGYVNLDDTSKSHKLEIDSIFKELDALRIILDSLGHDSIPIWVTEIGWQRNWWGDYFDYPARSPNNTNEYDADTAISNRLAHYAEMALNPERRQWLEKTFIFSLQTFPFADTTNGSSDYSLVFRPVTLDPGSPGGQGAVYFNNGEDSGHIYYPESFHSYSTLSAINNDIGFLIPQITLIRPDNLDTTFNPGNFCTISYKDVSDNISTYTTSTPLECIPIRIEYSTDDGSTWDTIIDSIFAQSQPSFGFAGDNQQPYGFGNYDWTIPYISSNHCKVRVIATDPYGLRGISTGDSVFSIQTDWPYEREPYSLEWSLTNNISGWDHCEYIIELANESEIEEPFARYLASVSIQEDPYNPVDSAGLIILWNTGGIKQTISYPRSSISKINCILETDNGNFILVGKLDKVFSSTWSIQLVDSSFNIIDGADGEAGMSSSSIGEIRDVIEISDSNYIAVGKVNSRWWMNKFEINNDSINIISEFYDSFSYREANQPGELFAVIEDITEDYFITVGNRSGIGSCFLKVNFNGIIETTKIYPYSGNWAGGIDLIKGVSDSNYIIVGKNDHTDSSYEQGAFIRKVDSIGDTLWENLFDEDSFPNFRSFNSVFIDNDSNIVAGGTGGNPNLNDYNIAIVAKFDSTGNFNDSFSAPFTFFYTDSIKESVMGRMTQTSDGGYIVGGRIYNTISWIKEIAICKFSYDGRIDPANQGSGGSQFGINAYSVVCASSVFRNQSTIRFMIPRNTHVNVCVYNILGQKVTTLVNGFKDAGVYEVIWNGTDSRGTRVSSGSYFLRFQTEDFIDTKSLTINR